MEELMKLFTWNELLDGRSHIFWAQISSSQLGTPHQIRAVQSLLRRKVLFTSKYSPRIA